MKNILRNMLLAVLLCASISPLIAQHDSVLISGIVYDYETREALRHASFKHNGEFIDISEDGKFQIHVKPNDSLSVKYLGYKDYVITIPKNLDHVSYISGVFLNKIDIDESEVLIVPRTYSVESLATFDPEEIQSMMQNAQHNINVAAYQATQPYEWDAEANQKYSVAMKNMELEYKGAISPNRVVGVGTSTTIQDLEGDFKVDRMGEKHLEHFSPISPKEEYYIKTLFEAHLQEGK